MAVEILYTNTDAIRSLIGLDDADVEDAMIVSQDMEAQMLLELEDWLPTHEEEFYATELSERRLKLWCGWFGALRLAESPLAIPKALGTGKDEYERFVVDWDLIKRTAKNKMAKLQEALVPAVGSTAFVGMGKAAPGYNVITGE